jgi:hypothetical protein
MADVVWSFCWLLLYPTFGGVLPSPSSALVVDIEASTVVFTVGGTWLKLVCFFSMASSCSSSLSLSDMCE